MNCYLQIWISRCMIASKISYRVAKRDLLSACVNTRYLHHHMMYYKQKFQKKNTVWSIYMILRIKTSEPLWIGRQKVIHHTYCKLIALWAYLKTYVFWSTKSSYGNWRLHKHKTTQCELYKIIGTWVSAVKSLFPSA